MLYASDRRKKLGRVVHYTSAENALKIIASKTMWLRNTQCMADYREVQHGYEMLARFFHDPKKRAGFYRAFKGCATGVAEEATQYFDQWWNNIRFNTYIASISEHDDSEDIHGRLSMWRGFGGQPTRAAIVMKPPPLGDADGLRLLLSPVAYFEYEQVEKQIRKVIRNVRANAEFIAATDREVVKNQIFFMLVTTAVSLKHVGFIEEREWRVIYIPDVHRSNLIVSAIEVIGGVPQIIYKVPLVENPADEVVGVGIPALVDRVIIGPTAYPGPTYAALVAVLQGAGVTDAPSRVVLSGIPLRQ
jgi:hypothetical protein